MSAKQTMNKIEVKNVFKVFGARAEDALQLIRQKKTKDQVLAETGCVVGVNDLSLSIGSGEIFVIMGLSGSGKSTLVRHFNRLIDRPAVRSWSMAKTFCNTTCKPCANSAGTRSAWCSRASACCRTALCWTTSLTG